MLVRPLLTILFATFLFTAHAAEFYVAPTGSDDAPGTLEKPFASLQRAQASAEPGDTVFLRGGTYTLDNSKVAEQKGAYARVFSLNKSGAAGKPIRYWAYENEKPVFDFTHVRPNDLRISAFSVTGDWLHFKSLEVVGVQVTQKIHTQSICFESNGSNNIFERLSLHDGQAIGIYHVRGSNNLFLNCDAYRNHDFTSEDGKGGNVDGFGCHPSKGSVGNIFRGCRAWFNSDDGYDCINSFESVIFENSWAFYNGYSPEFKSLCDGNGFKAGGYGTTTPDRLPKIIPRHIVRFCVAARNKSSGFYANHHIGGGDWLNNSAYRNGTNFNFLCRVSDNTADVPGYGHLIRNNLGYGTKSQVSKLDLEKSDSKFNSFTLELKLTDADFRSIDETQLMQPRQPDGSLPAIPFLHLNAGSACIDAGTDVGHPFRGKAPDLGAFESE